MKKTILLAAMTSLLLVGPSFANNNNNAQVPQRCPSAETIAREGFDKLIRWEQVWVATHRSFYDLKEEWMFVDAVMIKDLSGSEAMQIAQNSLATLELMSPEPVKQEGSDYACLYTTDFNTMTLALTPPDHLNMLTLLVKQYK
jgi:hypothetical protein